MTPTQTAEQAPRVCEHLPSQLPYIAWHRDADARHRAGERQRRCPDCLTWFWPHEYGEAQP